MTILFLPQVIAQSHEFKTETIAEGLTVPWGIAKLPDGRFLVTERPGQLRIIENGQLLPEPVQGVPEVFARGQGGLLDVVLHPDYADNGWIYLAYSKPVGEGSLTAIIRGRLKDGRLVDQETIFDPPVDQATKSGAHFGCRLAFDGKGYLFFSIGDRGKKENAQELNNVMGKIHRIHDDGRIPADNPFVKTPGAQPTIWSYGNRNAQGLCFQPETGLLWESEHGPRGGDELNLIKKGANYGWPVVTYGINYNGTPITDKTEAPGIEPPVVQWTPSIAVCGMDFYTGDKFPNWKGNLFAATLAHQKLVRIVIDGEKVTEQEILLEKTGRMRDVACFDDGYIYILYENPGRVVRLVPAS